jgi:hypothetical protein
MYGEGIHHAVAARFLAGGRGVMALVFALR